MLTYSWSLIVYFNVKLCLVPLTPHLSDNEQFNDIIHKAEDVLVILSSVHSALSVGVAIQDSWNPFFLREVSLSGETLDFIEISEWHLI